MHLDVLHEESRVEPTDFLVRRPKLAGLVDINLAGLLGVRLSEFLALAKSLNASLENATLAAEICSTVQTKDTGDALFSLVEKAQMWIFVEIQWLTLPFDL